MSGLSFSFDEPCEYLARKLGLPIEKVIDPDAHSFDIDYSHTTRQVGWKPQYDVEKMIDAALAWQEDHQG